MKDLVMKKIAIFIFAVIIVILLSWDTFFGTNPVAHGSFEEMKTIIATVGYSVN